MLFREATSKDIPKMHAVRTAVKENQLADSDLVEPADYQRQLQGQGKGWVCEIDENIVGFGMVDLQAARVLGLYVHPAHEGQFIGRMLHDMLVTWCFARSVPKLTITTPPHSRAEKFCTNAGWVKTGERTNGEIIFTLENDLEL